MRVTAYRITQTKFSLTAFDGEGARLNGGRWNSIGIRMVYTAGSLSLATLEVLVHTEDISTIYGRYTVIPIEFNNSLAIDLVPDALPLNWNNPEPVTATQMIGDKWIKTNTSVLLKVPSAVTENEFNFLLNPAHPDFAKIKIGSGFVFKPDLRLDAGGK